MPLPLVAVSTALRSPIRPRVGIANSRRTLPRPSLTMSSIRARRLPVSSVTWPTNSSVTSITRCSTGSLDLAVFAPAGDDFRPGDLELIALAAHRFDQDREVQFAATGDGEDIRLVGRLNPQREIDFEFPLEAIAELAGGRELAVASGERRGADAEGQLQGRLFDRDGGQRFRMLGIGQGGADLGVRRIR